MNLPDAIERIKDLVAKAETIDQNVQKILATPGVSDEARAAAAAAAEAVADLVKLAQDLI